MRNAILPTPLPKNNLNVTYYNLLTKALLGNQQSLLKKGHCLTLERNHKGKSDGTLLNFLFIHHASNSKNFMHDATHFFRKPFPSRKIFRLQTFKTIIKQIFPNEFLLDNPHPPPPPSQKKNKNNPTGLTNSPQNVLFFTSDISSQLPPPAVNLGFVAPPKGKNNFPRKR